MDERTAKKLRSAFAQVLVEVDFTQPLRDIVIIWNHLNRKIEHKNVYEWKPTYCSKCLKLGHDCTKKVVMPQNRQVFQRRAPYKNPTVWKAKPTEVGKTSGVVKQGPVAIGNGQSSKPVTENEPQNDQNQLATVGHNSASRRNGFAPLGIENDPGGDHNLHP